MSNVINLLERTERKKSERYVKLDDLEKRLANIDAEAVCRAINPEAVREEGVDYTLRSIFDKQKMTECFEAFSEASHILKKSNADWGRA